MMAFKEQFTISNEYDEVLASVTFQLVLEMKLQ